MNTSKSPKRVMMTAYVTAQRALPAYAHRFSPKKFTQHQLFACLVLKEFLKTDYRGCGRRPGQLPRPLCRDRT